MGLYDKLLEVQTKLKAIKGQYNSFGKYNYRSCEDILEAVKPLLKEQKLLLTLEDKVEEISGRFYIVAIATIRDLESDTNLSVTARAREEDTKKGMDSSQVTGATSSYARKYALNGLFLIDDNKDADTNERKLEERKQLETEIFAELKRTGVTLAQVTSFFEKVNLDELTEVELKKAVDKLHNTPNRKE